MALTRLDNLYSSKTGKYLYVSPDDFNATDELDNRGNSPLRPFKTIQRAFIEVARYSYLPGKDNDRFDQFSIMLMPGDHYIDNRPGLVDFDEQGRQRYYDAQNLITANRQEIIDRAYGEIAIQYNEVSWGNNWVVPGDDVVQDKNRYFDAYRLIQKNRTIDIDYSYFKPKDVINSTLASYSTDNTLNGITAGDLKTMANSINEKTALNKIDKACIIEISRLSTTNKVISVVTDMTKSRSEESRRMYFRSIVPKCRSGNGRVEMATRAVGAAGIPWHA